MVTGIKKKIESSAKQALVPKAATKVASKLATDAKPKLQAKSNTSGKPVVDASEKTSAVAKSDVKAKSTAIKKTANAKKPVTTKKPEQVKKVATVKKAAVVAKALSVEVATKEKHKKPKLVRDSFTMPEAEYALLGEVKKACIAAGIEVKKSQLLRIGLQLLKKTPVTSLKTMIAALPPLKAGRPKLN